MGGVAITGGIIFGVVATAVIAPSAPHAQLSCDWAPVRISGGNHAQQAAVRCYLQALAHRDTDGMDKVTRVDGYGSDETITSRAFKYATDDSSGIATVSFKQNSVDTADAEVDIRFSDGRTDVQELHIADPTSATSWRFVTVNHHTSQSYTNAK